MGKYYKMINLRILAIKRSFKHHSIVDCDKTICFKSPNKAKDLIHGIGDKNDSR